MCIGGVVFKAAIVDVVIFNTITKHNLIRMVESKNSPQVSNDFIIHYTIHVEKNNNHHFNLCTSIQRNQNKAISYI